MQWRFQATLTYFFVVALTIAGFSIIFFFIQHIIPQFRSTYCYSALTVCQLKGRYDIILSGEIGQGLKNLERKILDACPFSTRCRKRLLRIFN